MLLLRSLLLLTSLLAPVPQALAQAPDAPIPEREIRRPGAALEAAAFRRIREDMREDAWSRAAATCTGRARYDGDRLILGETTGAHTFTDAVEAYDAKGLYWIAPRLHLIERCDDQLRLTIVEVMHEEWGEYLLVPWDSPHRPLHLFGPPHPAPGGQAVVAVAHNQEAPSERLKDRGIEIALRDALGTWRKAWHHVPVDAWTAEFLRWEGPNRIRVLMHDRPPGAPDRKRWETVIEITPTSLIRTDGPKSPEPPKP